MLENVFFISMEGKKDFTIGDFKVREDISLPVYVEEGKQFSMEDITPENIITGMIKVLQDNPQNENVDYYREFIFTINPEIETKLSAIAYEAERSQHYADALSVYRVLYALLPDSLEQNLNIANCYEEFSNYLYSQGEDSEASKFEDQAYHFYKIVDEFEEKSDSAFYYLGRFFLSRENYTKAREYFDEFVKSTDDEDRKSEALQLLKDLSFYGMEDENYQMALELVNSDKNKEAIEYIDKYLQEYPKSWNGYFLMGIALRKAGSAQDAIPFFEGALKLNPDSSDVFNEIGLCYMDLKEFHKSQLNFSRALSKSPDDAAILYNLAVCSFRSGDKNEAIKYCDIIQEFHPQELNSKKLKKIIEESDI